MKTNRFDRVSPGVYRDKKNQKLVTPPDGTRPAEASIGGGTVRHPPRVGPPLIYRPDRPTGGRRNGQ